MIAREIFQIMTVRDIKKKVEALRKESMKRVRRAREANANLTAAEKRKDQAKDFFKYA